MFKVSEASTGVQPVPTRLQNNQLFTITVQFPKSRLGLDLGLVGAVVAVGSGLGLGLRLGLVLGRAVAGSGFWVCGWAVCYCLGGGVVGELGGVAGELTVGAAGLGSGNKCLG